MSEEFEHGDIIYTSEAEARIKALTDLLENGEEGTFFAEDNQGELTELVNFRNEVTERWGESAWAKGISLVADTYWEYYADERAKDIYGEAAGTRYWDADLFAEHLREDYQAVTFAGTKYWGDGQR
jgi:hypothetical protein